MFAGIVEELGLVEDIRTEGSNVHFDIQAECVSVLKIDQSISHNGVCLTVVDIQDPIYTVTAIKETLERTNLGSIKKGTKVNLERCITPETRIDGHYVQGHVDTTVQCLEIEEVQGSWYFTFELEEQHAHLMVDKGSVAINGVSLTVVNPTKDAFQVAIIPYTYQHTTFKQLRKGDRVNIEFDILGKYVARNMEMIQSEKISNE